MKATLQYFGTLSICLLLIMFLLYFTPVGQI